MANGFWFFHLLLLIHNTRSQYCPLNPVSRYHAAGDIGDNLYCNPTTSTTLLGACTDTAFPGIGSYTLQENPKFYLYSSTTGDCSIWSTDVTIYVGIMISGSDRDTLISNDYNEVNSHCNRANCVYTLGYCSSIDPGDGYHALLYKLWYADFTDHFYTTETSEVNSVAPPYVVEGTVCYVRTDTIPPTNDPTQSPTTKIPTTSPTKYPTQNPTQNPTKYPTQSPTKIPTSHPTTNPTKFPTQNPSQFPTVYPTKHPTMSPVIITDNPSAAPSQNPSEFPSQNPSEFPTYSPSVAPTFFGGQGVKESTKNMFALTESVESVRNEGSFFKKKFSLIIYVLIGLISLCCIGLIAMIYWFVRHKNKQIVQETAENKHGYVLEVSPTMTASPTMNSTKMCEGISIELMNVTTKGKQIERIHSNDELTMQNENETDEDDMDEFYTEHVTKGENEFEENENDNVLDEELYESDNNGNDLYTKGGVNVTTKYENHNDHNDEKYVKSPHKTETKGFSD